MRDDLRRVNKRYERTNVYYMQDVVSPKFLPSYSLIGMQQLVHKKSIPADYIFYTEADHVVHFEDIHIDCGLLDKQTFISPVRIEKVFEQGIPGRGVPVISKGEKYVAYAVGQKNGLKFYESLQKRPRKHKYYITSHPVEAYGGAWLCTRDLFLAMPYHLVNLLQPLESVSYIMALNARALKAVQWHRCYVDHLSGFEYQQRCSAAAKNNVKKAV